MTVLARSAQAAAEIACIATARAVTSASPSRFTAGALDASDRKAVAEELARSRPGVVINCASLQSPWESRRAPTAWTGLLAAGGFGIGVPKLKEATH
ncbi:hypothetical protein ACFVJH_38535 [Streptomyces decoyicus]|uniref:hypothetical protein n=1 Tax=Streptomyces decoyicus TaxID=249567 RepID=UPI003640B031